MMSTGPAVSVVIPAYNAAATVGAAIESCLRQTLQDLEVIVVDDGSKDDTVAAVRRHLHDPRVRLIELGTNGGVANARNVALDAATGTWVATLDADDTMTDDRLAVLLDALQVAGADMVSDDDLLVREGETEPYSTLTKITGTPITEVRTIDLDLLIDGETAGRSSFRFGLTQPIIRRALLDEHGIRYDTSLGVGEDYLLYLECVLAGGRWIQVPTAHYVYVQRAGSVSRTAQTPILEGKLRSCERLLGRPSLTAAQRASLLRYRGNLRSMLAYKRVAEAAKDRRLVEAAKAALGDPRFIRRVGEQVPAVVKRRWAYHVRKDPTAFDMLR